VFSPIDGVVLRRHHRSGKDVTSPDPIVTLGDTTALRVRVDVDEDDVARIRVGERGYVTAHAFGGLIQLDDGHELPVGLRVDSFISVSRHQRLPANEAVVEKR